MCKFETGFIYVFYHLWTISYANFVSIDAHSFSPVQASQRPHRCKKQPYLLDLMECPLTIFLPLVQYLLASKFGNSPLYRSHVSMISPIKHLIKKIMMLMLINSVHPIFLTSQRHPQKITTISKITTINDRCPKNHLHRFKIC